jgi:general secretion pathway protein D
MAHSNDLRDFFRAHWLSACLAICVPFTASGIAQQPADAPTISAQSPSDRPANQAPQTAAQAAETSAAAVAQAVEPAPDKRQARAAEDAYLAGAKRLEHDDLSGAERDFIRAQQLDPQNRNYAIAIAVAREHRLTELVQQAGKARLAGDIARSSTLLAEARAIDPANPLVLEHTDPSTVAGPIAEPQTAAGSLPSPRRNGESTAGQTTPLSSRGQMISSSQVREPWKIESPAFAGTMQLRPSDALSSFHLRGDVQDLLRQVATVYGIRVVFDDSVGHKDIRFDLDNQPYAKAMPILMTMAHVFAVPIDPTSVLIAKDDSGNRQRLERQVEETIALPGMTIEQINDLGNTIRNVFDIKQAVVLTGLGSILVRAPEATLGPLNRVLQDLIQGTGEVMLEVKMYEIDTTHTRDIGATIPQQFTTFNVDAAATNLVNQNQALVQEGIAQGLISPTANNLTIAEALIASGLVQSTLLTNLVGVFGGGIIQTGINGSVATSVSLSLNATDTRALDDIQLRLQDRQAATIRAGERYPIITSTYSAGVSAAPSSLSNASINGVSVASLLAQFSGGTTSATVPVITYEDLGVTLKATPVIQRSGLINLTLDMKIESLSGNSLDGNPILGSRQFASVITLADGESAMMVSYVTRSESAAVTGLPGLSELPGFEAPVDQNAEKDTGQLVVVITPHVIRKRPDALAGPRIPVPSGAQATAAN